MKVLQYQLLIKKAMATVKILKTYNNQTSNIQDYWVGLKGLVTQIMHNHVKD